MLFNLYKHSSLFSCVHYSVFLIGIRALLCCFQISESAENVHK